MVEAGTGELLSVVIGAFVGLLALLAAVVKFFQPTSRKDLDDLEKRLTREFERQLDAQEDRLASVRATAIGRIDALGVRIDATNTRIDHTNKLLEDTLVEIRKMAEALTSWTSYQEGLQDRRRKHGD